MCIYNLYIYIYIVSKGFNTKHSNVIIISNLFNFEQFMTVESNKIISYIYIHMCLKLVTVNATICMFHTYNLLQNISTL